MLETHENPAALELKNSKLVHTQITRLLIALHQHAGESLIFRLAHGNIRASVLKDEEEVSVLPIKAEQYEPIRRWFIQRFCSSPGSPHERGAAPDPCIGFPIAMRYENRLLAGLFKESIVTDTEKTLLFNLQETHSVQDALLHFGVRKGVRDIYLDACEQSSGVLFVFSPNIAHLRATTATALSLSQGHYLGPLQSEAVRACLGQDSKDDVLVVSLIADDELEALSDIASFEHELGILPEARLLAGVFTHRLCPHCVRQATGKPTPMLPHFEGIGCEHCDHKGYRGYIGCQSVMTLTQEMLLTVMRKGSAAGIQCYRDAGMMPLYFDAALKVQQQLIPLKEFHDIFQKDNPFREHHEFLYLQNGVQTETLEPEDRTTSLPKGSSQNGKAHHNGETSLAQQVQQESTGPQSILLVEDDSDQREMMQFLFEAQGYRLYVAKNGVEALSVLDGTRVDLIVTDLMMPEMDGYALVKELKSHTSLSSIPVLVLTAINEADKEVTLLENGADDFVAKSSPRKVLLSRIARLLR